VLPFVEPAAEIFARMRIGGRVKPPDAIQLATAAHLGCDLFLTNDDRLLGIAVPGIHFITSFEKAPI
jgi:predicted nucleic acid-binding protein